jgi:hypothetical protein
MSGATMPFTAPQGEMWQLLAAITPFAMATTLSSLSARQRITWGRPACPTSLLGQECGRTDYVVLHGLHAWEEGRTRLIHSGSSPLTATNVHDSVSHAAQNI